MNAIRALGQPGLEEQKVRLLRREYNHTELQKRRKIESEEMNLEASQMTY